MKNLQTLKNTLAELRVNIDRLEAQIAESENDSFPTSIKDLDNMERFFVATDGVLRNGLVGAPYYSDLPTKEAAVSSRAFNQLAMLIHHINGGDKPKYCSVDFRFRPYNITYADLGNAPSCLCFARYEDAKRSAEAHIDLWRQYYTGVE